MPLLLAPIVKASLTSKPSNQAFNRLNGLPRNQAIHGSKFTFEYSAYKNNKKNIKKSYRPEEINFDMYPQATGDNHRHVPTK